MLDFFNLGLYYRKCNQIYTKNNCKLVVAILIISYNDGEVKEMSFGEKLAKLRKDAGMNQEELANNLGVSRQAVSKWESNNSYPETDKIVAICKLFNCSMDDLLGTNTKEESKEKKVINENKTLSTINKYFDMFLNGIDLFFRMTFKQKIICLIELFAYAVILFCAIFMLEGILLEVLSKIFVIMPYTIRDSLINIIDGICIIIAIIAFIYAISKFYKIRYLDYYNSSSDSKKIVVEEHSEEVNVDSEKINIKSEKINVNKEKIIIRDPNSAYKPFNWLKKICKLTLKFFVSCILFGLIIAFVVCIALLFIALYFLKVGAIVVYTALGILGGVICLYIFIELFIKFIFDKKQQFIRLFVMFIISLLLMGISSGLFACELTKFTIIDENSEADYLVQAETIKMEDNLILYLENTEVVFEKRDDILIEAYSTMRNNDLKLVKHQYNETPYYQISSKTFNIQRYYLGYNGNRIEIDNYIQEFLNSLKNKEIVVNDYSYYRTVLHISEENYRKLNSNLAELHYRNNDDCYCE